MPTQYLFLINGISSLLGYNALLTSLDYFDFVYDGYDVHSLFLPPVFLGYVVVVLSLRWISKKYTYKALVTFGIVSCNFLLFILLVLSLTQNRARASVLHSVYSAALFQEQGLILVKLSVWPKLIIFHSRLYPSLLLGPHWEDQELPP